MFEIKVTVEAPELAKAINQLANSLGGNGMVIQPAVNALVEAPVAPSKPDPVPTPAPVQPEAPAPVQAPESAKEAPSTPAPAPEAPAAPEPASEPAKVYTFDQISKVGAKLCTTGKMDQLVSLLNGKYGVPAITMIDESRYAELAADLIALGAVFEEE